MSRIEPIGVYVQKLSELRNLAETDAARSYLDDLVNFYRDQVDVVDTRADGDVTLDTCRYKQARDLPKPPTFKSLGIAASATTTAPASNTITQQRPPLGRIRELLLGPNPGAYFGEGKIAPPSVH